MEKLDDEGNFKGKADMFTKRTIKRAEVVTSVDTASEALAVSLAEKAKIDLDFMGELPGKIRIHLLRSFVVSFFRTRLPMSGRQQTSI